jgi:hypothetical protein
MDHSTYRTFLRSQHSCAVVVRYARVFAVVSTVVSVPVFIVYLFQCLRALVELLVPQIDTRILRQERNVF